MAAVLRADNISLRFADAPQPVLQGFSLAIERGEFVAVVGGSGVGKSTLLRAFAGLLAPETGQIAVNTVGRQGQRRRAVVFQDGRLMPWRSLRANIAYGLSGLSLTPGERDARIAEVLRLTGLTAFANRYPHQLSGGQMQRGGIARALAVKPDVLLMDEPFSAVDAITRKSLQDELTAIWRATGAAVLFVTHDIGEAVLLADRVVVLAGAPARIALDQRVKISRPRQREDANIARATANIASFLS